MLKNFRGKPHIYYLLSNSSVKNQLCVCGGCVCVCVGCVCVCVVCVCVCGVCGVCVCGVCGVCVCVGRERESTQTWQNAN